MYIQVFFAIRSIASNLREYRNREYWDRLLLWENGNYVSKSLPRNLLHSKGLKCLIIFPQQEYFALKKSTSCSKKIYSCNENQINLDFFKKKKNWSFCTVLIAIEHLYIASYIYLYSFITSLNFTLLIMIGSFVAVFSI